MVWQPADSDWDFTLRRDGEIDDPAEALGSTLRSLEMLAREVGIDPGGISDRFTRADEEPYQRRVLDELPMSLRELADEIHRLIGQLDGRLSDRGILSREPAFLNSPKKVITQTLFAGRKAVHLGFVGRYFVVPLSLPLSSNMYAYLSRVIPGERDILVSENHGCGWHYHYCDRSERRSDTIMSFDVRRRKKLGGADRHPLSSEQHGVKKAAFHAKPWMWGDKKRISIYGACAPDLGKKKATAFKTPSQEAEDVWPR